MGDLAELLGNSASGPLLILIAIPLLGAIFFAAVIAVSISRRRKRSEMKLGSQPKQPPPPAKATSAAGDDLDTSVLSHLAPASELNPDLLSPASPPPSTSSELLATSPKSDATTEVQSSPGSQETFALESPQPLVEEKVDLAARLGDLSAAKSPSTRAPIELLRLLREPESGQLLVEVTGQHYLKLSDITDKKIGQYILKLTAHLLAFTNGMIETEAGLKSVYNPRVGPTPEPIVATPPTDQLPDARSPSPPPPTPAQPEPSQTEPSLVPKPPPEAEAAFLASIREQSEQPTPPQRRGLLGRSRPAPQPTILPSLNLADEINKIVQARLMASPLAATTEIDITDDLSGGICIKVNGVTYSTPAEIPDVEVRELIKVSIKQWERS